MTGCDYSTLRRIGRVVLRGKDEPLSEDEERRAARYAAVMSRWLPYQAVQSVLLFAGIVLVNAPFERGQHGVDPVRIALVVLLVAVAAAVIPLQVSRARRARRYAVTHAALSA